MLFLLILWPVFIFIILTLIMLPLQFTVKSVFGILTIPGEILKIASNRRLRQNHALEHATINVIEEYYGRPLPLAGLAKEDGFFIKGPVDPSMVEEAARIGLARLRRGEHHLVIHQKCGTSIAMANFVSSVVFLILLFSTGLFNFLNILIAIVLANLLGPILGRIVQKYLTTDPHVDGLDIAGVETILPGYGFVYMFSNVAMREYFVRTHGAYLTVASIR